MHKFAAEVKHFDARDRTYVYAEGSRGVHGGMCVGIGWPIIYGGILESVFLKHKPTMNGGLPGLRKRYGCHPQTCFGVFCISRAGQISEFVGDGGRDLTFCERQTLRSSGQAVGRPGADEERLSQKPRYGETGVQNPVIPAKAGIQLHITPLNGLLPSKERQFRVRLPSERATWDNLSTSVPS